MDDTTQVPRAVGAFLFASLAWLLVVGVVTGGAMAAVALGAGETMESFSADPDRWLTPGVMGLSALTQALGLGGIAFGLAWGLSDDRSTFVETIRGRPGWWGWSVAAAVGALSVGLLPGWMASQIISHYPSLGGTLEVLAETMQMEAPLGKGLLVVAICVAAPVCEEVAFRGYLWRWLGRLLPGWAVWIGTTLLFAGYHLDPVQSPSLIPTALFLGWLRWHSGSVLPAIVGHLVNNVLAMLGLFLASTSGEAEISFASAGLGALATILCCTAAWLARPRS